MPNIKSLKLFVSTLFVASVVLLPSQLLSAAQQPEKMKHTDEEKLKQFEKRVDSLVYTWKEQSALDTTNYDIDFLGEEGMIKSDIPDSVFIRRLASIPSLIDLPYNNVVRASILWYIDRRKAVSERILGKKDYYFPIFEETLDKHGLPMELVYLPVIESALNPVAVSRVGATGLWQFMYGTGRQYDLNVTSFVDERRDPIASSEAAARFLKDLYNIYKDWTLVIAAYNCGPRNVNKAIRRAGGSRNYWAIYNFLPRETRGYVPNFIAAAYMFKYHKEHNITPVPSNLTTATDTIHVNKMLHFQQVSSNLNLPLDKLRELNPQYKKDIIPGIEKPYTLVLPQGYASSYIANESLIHSSDSAYFTQNNFPSLMASSTSLSETPELGTKRVAHKIRRGESIGVIANKYNVDIASIKEWNRGKIKKNNMLIAGQTLTIYKSVPISISPASKQVAKNNTATGKPAASTKDSTEIKIETVTTINQSVNEKPQKVVASKTGSTPSGKVVYYTVKKNDTLWTIAQKYDGVTAKDIQKQNKISSTRGLQVGQKLKIVIN